MSDSSPFGFGRFVPGFDFLQSLAKGSAAGMPSMSSWVAPTVSVQELEKRIEELKAVQFWLEQNARALAATLQALEVQKMTLETLKGMNVAMGDLAEAFAGRPGAAAEPAAPSAFSASPSSPPSSSSSSSSSSAFESPKASSPFSKPAADKPVADGDAPAAAPAPDEEPSQPAAPGVVDPMQWWSALGAQFQQIAANAMSDVAHTSALDATREMAAGAMKTATDMASQFAAQATRGAPAAAGGAAPRGAKRTAAGKAAAPRSTAAKKAPAKAATKTAGRATDKAADKTAGKTAGKAAGKTAATSSRKTTGAAPRPAARRGG